jgi:hypothetical protein
MGKKFRKKTRRGISLARTQIGAEYDGFKERVF